MRGAVGSVSGGHPGGEPVRVFSGGMSGRPDLQLSQRVTRHDVTAPEFSSLQEETEDVALGAHLERRIRTGEQTRLAFADEVVGSTLEIDVIAGGRRCAGRRCPQPGRRRILWRRRQPVVREPLLAHVGTQAFHRAAIAGVALGYALATRLMAPVTQTMRDHYFDARDADIVFSFPLAAAALALALLVTVLAALGPALAAARAEPADAGRHAWQQSGARRALDAVLFCARCVSFTTWSGRRKRGRHGRAVGPGEITER